MRLKGVPAEKEKDPRNAPVDIDVLSLVTDFIERQTRRHRGGSGSNGGGTSTRQRGVLRTHRPHPQVGHAAAASRTGRQTDRRVSASRM